jgi:hypothetical protein
MAEWARLERKLSHRHRVKALDGTLSFWSKQDLAQDQVLHPIHLCGNRHGS